jgi:hypothetical protein
VNPLSPPPPPVAKGADVSAALASAAPSSPSRDLTATRTTVPPATAAPPDVAASSTPRTPPQAPAATVNPQDQLRQLARQAAECYASLSCYQARLIRQEEVNGTDKPREEMLFKFRKQPFSVYFKWIGTVGQGREVVYVNGQHEGKIHTLLADGDMLGMRGGGRFAVAPDSMLVRNKTRHPITEAGIGSLVDHFGHLVDAAGQGDPRANVLTYLGPQSRPEFSTPLEAVQQRVAPGAESQLPHGGRRWWFFAADNHLPVLVIAHDEKDHQVEYYCYDALQVPPAPFTDDDFNPDRLWPKR